MPPVQSLLDLGLLALPQRQRPALLSPHLARLRFLWARRRLAELLRFPCRDRWNPDTFFLEGPRNLVRLFWSIQIGRWSVDSWVFECHHFVLGRENAVSKYIRWIEWDEHGESVRANGPTLLSLSRREHH